MSRENDQHLFIISASVNPDITGLGQELYGWANHFLTNQLNMCAGGTVPLSILKCAAVESTVMNLKDVC